ncbi:MAG: flagellar hook protein, partial [Lachnospiraceae bacterium]|nr:flagellar hook protein [Lachnospiraceae bacterium]
AIDTSATSKTDISLKDAYRMMGEELKAASSVGADVEASVLQKGDGVFEITQGKVEIANELSFALHVGADADMTNKISVGIKTMSSAGLGVKNLNVADDSGKAATYAIDAISDAIETVSKQRSLLGAVQNRLEHTINNLDNVAENTTSAESQIRDTDMATEMVKYSNANILAQAGQSMLAQANQSNQGVLSILG